MSTTNQQIYELYAFRSPAIIQRIEGSLVKWLDQVLGEDPATANHANRVLLAGKLLDETNRQKTATMMLPIFANNGTYQQAGEAVDDPTVDWLVITHCLGNPAFISGLLSQL